ncbi:NUDIX hydrolase [Rothia aerolata]|uniref:NUDIX hydrolase n=1 Tax=Rothia aerolata TaxID=1812262 RepID=A0A917IQD4_9MICC|nr:NUDIX hydrolase [Rothia aerolata]GGH61283.1 hypothetical protein GCM10007359_10290 [Rothia aerolata]
MPNQALYTGALKAVRPRSEASAAPRSTSRERLFKIPAELVPAARAWLESGDEAPCQLRTASTVVFVRDGQDGLETILTYRPGLSPMGSVAFPGGVSVADDCDPLPWIGPSPQTWAQAFKEDDVVAAHAAVVGAIRESFEETGMLLAGSDELSTVEGSADGFDQMAAREAVASGDKRFSDYLSMRGLKLRTDLLKPLSRWQSPDYRHKRYDIHYFACAAPVGQSAALLKSKGIWGEWVNVRELIADPTSTRIGDAIGAEETVGKPFERLVTPGTLCVLETLAAASTSVAFLAQKRTVQVKKAEIIEQDGEYLLRYTTPKKAGTWEKCSL